MESPSITPENVAIIISNNNAMPNILEDQFASGPVGDGITDDSAAVAMMSGMPFPTGPFFVLGEA